MSFFYLRNTYTQSTNVSVKQRIAQTQSKLIVKKELVATYGLTLVVSGLSARTRQVQQFPSTFSTLNTLEQVVDISVQVAVESLLVGIVHGAPLPQQV